MQKMSDLRSLVLLSLVLVSSACTNTEDVLPETSGSVSYAADIQPIFNTSCVVCHSTAAPLNGISFSNYAAVMASSGTSYGGLIVLPGNAAGSPLVDKIEPSPAQGTRMPQGGSPLSATQISKIRQWINDGAPNN